MSHTARRFMYARPARVAGLFVWVFLASTVAVWGQEADLVVVGGTADVGEIVSVELRVETAPNEASAIGIDIVYDPALLRYADSFARGDLLEGFTLVDVALIGDGRVRLAAIAVADAIAMGASGSLVTIDFELLACPADETVLAIDTLVDDVVSWTTMPGAVACGPPEIFVSDEDLHVDARAGSLPVTVRNIGDGMLEWSAAVIEGADWLSVTPLTGSDGDSFAIEHAANDSGAERIGLVRVRQTGIGIGGREIRVVQRGVRDDGDPGLVVATSVDGPRITVAINVRRAPNDAVAFGFDLEYDSNLLAYTGDFTPGALIEDFEAFMPVEVGPGIVRVPAAGGEARITQGETGLLASFEFEFLKCPEPETEVRLSAFVDDVVPWDAFSDTVACAAALIGVTPSSLSVGASSGQRVVQIERLGEGDIAWTAEVLLGSAWLSVSPESGMGEGELVVTYQLNANGQRRDGVIRIATAGPDGQAIDVNVMQAASATGGPDGAGCAATASDGADSSDGSGEVLLVISIALAVVRRRTREAAIL